MIFKVSIFTILAVALVQVHADITTTTEATTTTTEAQTTEPQTATEPQTTTEPPTTSEPPTTTPAPTPTPEPSPAVKYFYNVTENGVTCIMIDGKFSLKVDYNLVGGNKTNETTIVVPEPSSAIKVEGSCSDDKQFIKISWGDVIHENNIKIDFKASNNTKDWSISRFSAKIFMDAADFINATDAEKSLTTFADLSITPDHVPKNHSFMCFASLTVANFTTEMDGAPYSYPVQLVIDGMQIQAFNKKPSKGFVEEIHCKQDMIADIVPIAVGCALVALVLVVLVAYIIGRRRRSASYQSV